jgi:Replication-relaxation
MERPAPSNQKTERQTPRSRFSAKPTAGVRLEERDKQLLGDLYLHRNMSRGQIEALYFGSTPRCNARLRQLFDHGFVSRYYLPAAPFGAQAIYSIGKVAVPVVARSLDIEITEVRRQYRRGKSPTFIEHTLEVVNLLIAFRAATVEHSDVEMERWLPEILCRHEYEIRSGNGGKWTKEVFKPDAFVRLLDHRSGTYHNFFIEVDLGHTSSRQFLSKLMSHQRYLESGLFQEVFGCHEFKTLVVTTSVNRLNNLRSLVEAQESGLFWFTTLQQCSKSVMEPIWHQPYGNCAVSLM